MIVEDIAIDHAMALGYNLQLLRKVAFCSALVAARAPELRGCRSGISAESLLNTSSGGVVPLSVLALKLGVSHSVFIQVSSEA